MNKLEIDVEVYEKDGKFGIGSISLVDFIEKKIGSGIEKPPKQLYKTKEEAMDEIEKIANEILKDRYSKDTKLILKINGELIIE